MTEAQLIMQAHDAQMEALLVQYLGEETLARGRSMTDLFLKKQWYGNRIHQLGIIRGRFDVYMRRCKRTDSPTYQKYQQHETDIDLATSHLIMELIAVK